MKYSLQYCFVIMPQKYNNILCCPKKGKPFRNFTASGYHGIFAVNFLIEKEMKRFGDLKSKHFDAVELSGCDAILVDGESLEWLLKIQNQFNRLQAMGEDEVRYFWIEVPSRKRKLARWYEVCSATYKDFHSLRIIDGRGYYCEILNKDRGCCHRYDITWFLKPFYFAVNKLIDSIVKNPDKYNRYVAENLPYIYRRGRIKRKTLYDISPIFRVEPHDKKASIEVLQKSIAKSIPLIKSMNIRTFCHYFRVAHELFFNDEHDDSISDIDYYKDHKFGYLENDMDVDDEDTFKKFAYDHYGELGLSRVNVHGYYLPEEEGWAIYASTSYSVYIEELLDIAVALDNAGAPLRIGDAQKLLNILEEKDYVAIRTYVFHDYLNHHEEGTVICLPYDEQCDDEGILWTREIKQKIIENAEWEPIKEVKTIELMSKIHEEDEQ